MEDSFGAALAAMRRGDVPALSRILDDEPALLEERCADREFAYFENPKLLWFLANNPILVERMPQNLVEVAGALIARGAGRDDLGATLGLVMSGSALREQGLQRALMAALLDAGATASPRMIETAAGHRELDALAMLVERGMPVTVEIAASLGDLEALRSGLAHASAREIQVAFDLAAINGGIDAMEALLAAGADADAYLTVHGHSTALHQATDRDDAAAIALLLAHGASRDARDKTWGGTPLDWADFLGRPAAKAALALA